VTTRRTVLKEGALVIRQLRLPLVKRKVMIVQEH
ncbi:hypothetical protein A2U01_0073891, partial [Trifolium medium]|nr:hypothetical protein [Trifolium medium]